MLTGQRDRGRRRRRLGTLARLSSCTARAHQHSRRTMSTTEVRAGRSPSHHEDLARSPGRAVPARRHMGRPGHQLLDLLGGRRARRVVPVRSRRRETRVNLPERTAFCWHGYLRGVGPASVTAFACTAPGIRQKDTAATRPSCSSIPTRAPSPAASSGTRRCFPIRSAATISSATTTTARRTCRKPSSSTTRFDWEGDRSAAPQAARDGHLRSARERIHEAASRRCRRPCAARTPASRIRPPSSTCPRSA